jgi:hypothetical protein
MTIVEVLCLNHRKRFGISWTSDSEGEKRVELCRAACHRMFRFYGGLDNILDMTWIYPADEVIHHKAEFIEYNNTASSPFSPPQLEKFYSVWENGLKLELFPEFWVPKPAKWVLYTQDAYRSFRAFEYRDQPFTTLINNMTLKSPPFSDEHDFEVLEQEAHLRTKSAMAFHYLSRNHEKEWLNSAKKLLESPILEQQWIILRALRYYSVGKFVNEESIVELSSIINKSLRNPHYLIRKEGLDLISVIALHQPKLALSMISSLVQLQDKNSAIFALRASQMFWRLMHRENEYAEEGFEDITNILIPRKGEHIHQIAEIVKIIHPIAISIAEKAMNRNTFWARDEKIALFIENPPSNPAQLDRYLLGKNFFFNFLAEPLKKIAFPDSP